MRTKNKSGMSLVEILVVITIFAILGILVTRSLLLTLRGAKKSESLVKVRENVDYSLGIIERQIRNAKSISCTSSTRLSYVDYNNTAAYFDCSGGRIASGSAVMTSSKINISSCSFVCTGASGLNLPLVTVAVTANDTEASGVESATFSTSLKIYLRTY